MTTPKTLQVHVRRDNLSRVELVDVPQTRLADGAVRLAVESFSVTANNVTYAVIGEAFGYWSFFPAPEGWGIVPMWGHARVVESNCPGIVVGERVYGYLPMAAQLDVVPGKISAGNFTDMTDYRQPLPPFYNVYSRLAADPSHDPLRESERMIFGPLFMTGFLIEYFMRANEWFGAGRVVLTSASSKTAMGVAAVTKQRSPEVKRIGLTSASNVEFVKGTGLYDEVLAYGDVGSLVQEPSVSVDFAGNPGLLRSIYETLGDNLKYSCLVGVTHVDERGEGLGAVGLPGPAPTLFFAPDHGMALTKEVGPQEAGRMMAESWTAFLSATDGSIRVDRRQGLEAARIAFLETLAGKADPSNGIVIEP